MKLIVLAFMFGITSFPCEIVGSSDYVHKIRPDYHHQYENYLNDYNKVYSDPSDYMSHYYSFSDNMERINNHNSGNYSWQMGINNFTDMSFEAFKSRERNMGAKKPKTGTNAAGSGMVYGEYIHMPMDPLPDAVDWRASGLVTNVKNQQQCGSCWAFSAVGAIEGAYAKKTNKLVSLSEQNLVDCAGGFGCDGCEGGWMNAAMEYVHYNGGIDSEIDYPYTAEDGVCKYAKNESSAKVKSVVNITQADDAGLLHAVATIGPISVAIDAEYDFQLYKSGIYSSTECNPQSLDHGVLVVGYGVTPAGKKYYMIKNSWGEDWGMNGYIYWDRDVPNMCGISQAASFPIV